MAILKLESIGTATGLVIPKEMLEKLNVANGDSLCAITTPHGLLLAPCSAEVAKELEIGRAFMRQYEETFKALAK